MASLLYLRTALRQLASQPLTWLCVAGLVAGWWALEVLMPLGLATGSLHRSTAHYELGFLAGAIAQAIALNGCLKLRWLVKLRGPVWGVATDMMVLVLSAAAVASFILVPAEAFQLWQFADFDTAEALVALVIGWAHLAAMACVVPLGGSRNRGTSTFRDNAIGVAWIAFATVLVPASIAGLTPHGGATLHILDPGRMLRASFAPTDLPTGAWLTALLPVLGWSLVALWLAQRGSVDPEAPSISPCATPSSETSMPT